MDQLKRGKIDFNDFPKPWVANSSTLLDQNDSVILNLRHLDIYKNAESSNLESVSMSTLVVGENKLAFQDSLSSFYEIDLVSGTVQKYTLNKQVCIFE